MSDLISGWGNSEATYSQEAEEATLGALLVNPVVFDQVAGIIQAKDFFLLRHRYVFEAMTALRERNKTVDYLTVCQELKDRKQLTEVGGPVYITQLVNATPASAHAAVYAGLVNSFAVRRDLLRSADSIKALALDTTKTIDEIVSAVGKTVTKAANGLKSQTPIVTLKDSIKTHWDYVDALYEKRIQSVTVPTGYRDLDDLQALGGLDRGTLTIVAGRSSMGKTAFGTNVLHNVARRGGRCLMGSLEMNERQLMSRLSGIITGVDTKRILYGQMTEEEYRKYVKATEILQLMDVGFDYSRHQTPTTVRRKCDELARIKPLDLIVIDGLWLMGHDTRYDSDMHRFEAVTRDLFMLAGDYDVPVLLMHQLNRGPEQRPDKRPTLADLREAGEQSADNVILLYRDEYYNARTERPGVLEAIVAKQRMGNVGSVGLYYHKTSTGIFDENRRTVLVDLNKDYHAKALKVD